MDPEDFLFLKLSCYPHIVLSGCYTGKLEHISSWCWARGLHHAIDMLSTHVTSWSSQYLTLVMCWELTSWHTTMCLSSGGLDSCSWGVILDSVPPIVKALYLSMYPWGFDIKSERPRCKTIELACFGQKTEAGSWQMPSKAGTKRWKLQEPDGYILHLTRGFSLVLQAKILWPHR